jgi:hypothetical protein
MGVGVPDRENGPWTMIEETLAIKYLIELMKTTNS